MVMIRFTVHRISTVALSLAARRNENLRRAAQYNETRHRRGKGRRHAA